jgi:hypothetical protein
MIHLILITLNISLDLQSPQYSDCTPSTLLIGCFTLHTIHFLLTASIISLDLKSLQYSGGNRSADFQSANQTIMFGICEHLLSRSQTRASPSQTVESEHSLGTMAYTEIRRPATSSVY